MLLNSDDILTLINNLNHTETARMIAQGRIGISEPARLELLAEECVELAHAALKLARILRGENPTDATLEETRANVVEEACDVCICLDLVDISLDPDIRMRKLERLAKRLSTAENGESDGK